jgi:AcrR family transcriptional regulator
MSEAGLRERKKQRTREAIVAAALRLFDERGYDQTTIADIAEAADIAPRTFFGYFPSKEDVVFADFPETVEGLSRQLDERAESETAIDAIRAWIEGKLDEVSLHDEQERCRKRVIADSPALEDHYRALMGQIEHLLAEHIARDLGDRPDALRPHMIASSVIGTLSALDGKGGDGGPQPTKKEALAMVDEALTFLQGGLDALRRRP